MTILVLSRFAAALEPLLRAGVPALAGPATGRPGTPVRLECVPSLRELPAELSEVEVVLTFQVPRGLPARAPALRWVQSTGAGVDRILAAAPGPHVQVTRMHGVFGRPLGEYALAALLAHAQRTEHARRQQEERVWRPFEVQPVAGALAGILGAGSIGQEIARLLGAAGLRVRGLRLSGAPHEAFEAMYAPSDLREFLRDLDYLVVVAPLTDDTRGLLDATALGCLPPHAFVINIARGQIFVEADLVEALRAGRLAGAALDVFSVEPLPADSPLWSLPTVRITPHVAGVSRVEEMAAQFLANLSRYMDGRPLLHAVDRARGY